MKPVCRQFLALLITVALVTAFRFPVDGFLTRLLEQFRTYNLRRPIEKTYLHTDRDVYMPGETIWLKGYLFNGNTHVADSVDKVLHVDLVDMTDRRLRLRAQLRATDGHAPGQFELPGSLAAGLYELRGYTNFMRNESEAYYFTKVITILDGNSPVVQTARLADQRPDIQFMPEGGQLVAGLSGRVAFKAIDASGRGETVSGFILNNQSDTVVGFASTHLGMGTFVMKPQAGQTYTAFIRQHDGTPVPVGLPPVLAQGVVLQVDNLSDKENIRVYVGHTKISSDPNASLTLLAQTHGRVVQTATIPLVNKSGTILLAKKLFPEGITQLTLFDETNQPVCERLIFIDHTNRINIAIEPNKSVYRPREKIDLTVTTTNEAGEPIPANLSMAVLDARLSPDLDSNHVTITSHLLLSSDLTGAIEQPAYYFNPLYSDRANKLDLLLLTQGWRRFVWTDVLADRVLPLKFRVEQGISVTGHVLRWNQKDIDESVNIRIVLAKQDSAGRPSQQQFLMGETDDDGNFGAYGLDFTDTMTVLVQGTKGKGNRNLLIGLDQLLMPVVTLVQPPYNPIQFSANDYAEFVHRTSDALEIERKIRVSREILLNPVTVVAPKMNTYDMRVIYGKPDATLKFTPAIANGRFTVMSVIQGRIPGVQVMDPGGPSSPPSVIIRGATGGLGVTSPLYLLNGVPTDAEMIQYTAVADVERVDVLKGASASIYGTRAAGGVISVLTKQATSDVPAGAPPGTLVAKLAGYIPVKEFYAPRYDQKPADGLNKPDYRTTLYWTPTIQTNAAGKATVSFFASDAKTTLHIHAEGANAIGMPGVGKRTVRVE